MLRPCVTVHVITPEGAVRAPLFSEYFFVNPAVEAVAEVSSVPEVGRVTVVVPVAVRVVANAPEVVKFPARLSEPVPKVKDEPEPAVVSRVPLVGRVTVVVPVAVRVVEKAPAVASVLPFTKVRVPVVVLTVRPLIVLLVSASEPARVASVPVVGRVTVVVPVAVSVVANAPEVVKFPPKVMVLPELATPVPPYRPAITEPFQVPVATVPRVVIVD